MKNFPTPMPTCLDLILGSFSGEINGLVRRYAQNGNLWEDDIRQEARIALSKLVTSGKIALHPVSGKLSTRDRGIAYMDMRQAVHRLVMPLGNSLSISASTIDKYRKQRARFAALRPDADLQSTTAAEVAAALQITHTDALNLLTVWRGKVSLEAPLSSSDNTATLGDFLADDTVAHPASRLEKSESTAKIRELLASVSPRQREVIERRLGLISGDEESCADIAAARGCTRQSVDEQYRTGLATILRQITDGPLAYAA